MVYRTTAAIGNVTEAGLAKHMQQIFNYMTGGVAVSGVVAWLTLNTPALLNIAAGQGTQILFLVIWIGFAFFMHKILFSFSPKVALGVFAAFSALTGFALSPLALVYTGASIATAFFTAAVMFGGASLYGYFSKKSLSGWGNFLMMGAWGLVGAIVVHMIMSLFGAASDGLSFIISLLAVPLFAGITAWETNSMKEQYAYLAGDETTRSSTAIYGAAGLYMNFVVMFLHLLNLLGQQRN